MIHQLFNGLLAVRGLGLVVFIFGFVRNNCCYFSQYTSDILRWAEARTMVTNSNFIAVMNQMEEERREIQRLLAIPPSLIGNITNSPKGTGIIYNENTLIPFASLYPKNNRPYELMTTDRDELVDILAKEERVLSERK